MTLPYPSYNDPFPSNEEVRSWDSLPEDERWRRQHRLMELRDAYYMEQRDAYYMEQRGGRDLVPGVDYGAGKARFDQDPEANGLAEWARRHLPLTPQDDQGQG